MKYIILIGNLSDAGLTAHRYIKQDFPAIEKRILEGSKVKNSLYFRGLTSDIEISQMIRESMFTSDDSNTFAKAKLEVVLRHLGWNLDVDKP